MLSNWILCSFLAVQITALRVLVVFPFTSPSHNLLGRAVVRHLLEANHERQVVVHLLDQKQGFPNILYIDNIYEFISHGIDRIQVVHITSFPYDRPVQNLTEISIAALGLEILKERENVRAYDIQYLMDKNNLADGRAMGLFTYDFHKRVLQNENMTRFLSDPREKFDVVLMEWFFSDLFAGIPSLFNCPFIWMASTDAHWIILDLAGDIPNPAHTPDIFSMGPARTLWERTGALVKFFVKYLTIKVGYASLEKIVYNAYYPVIAAKRGVTMPPYNVAVYNASMVFVNSHPTIGLPHNLPLNVKYIGGYHINGNMKPISHHLQNIMDSAKHGVIYFSLGTNLESKLMSREMIQSLLKMFSKLKQAVIWKFEDVLHNVPDNVYLEKWAPQLNILAHPNLKMFITHGGRMSLAEAVYYGVPVIGIPVYGDQFLNMKATVMKNAGVEVPLSEDLANNLLVAIREVLENSMYKTAAQEMSTIYHHRLASPGQELVYWVQHTVKSRGAVHLRSPAWYMPMYQKLYLDLLAVLVFSVLLMVFVCRFVRSKVAVKVKCN